MLDSGLSNQSNRMNIYEEVLVVVFLVLRAFKEGAVFGTHIHKFKNRYPINPFKGFSMS